MTIQQIIYALTIAETKSMNKAAEKLFISQPSLTGAVKELEKETGITIFIRGARGVSCTNDGEEFLSYARQVYRQYELLMEKYGSPGHIKRKFGVSAQHYSFAVKAFVDMVKEYGTDEYEFALRETKTYEVITDVGSAKSEIGVLFMSDFNRRVIEKMLRRHSLEFHPLARCDAYVYLWKNHPLAGQEKITFDQLRPYPCLSFEQGEESSLFLSEEILSDRDYPRTIKATDRATMLNLMVGLNGYTLCSGIISEELNGGSCVVVPFEADGAGSGGIMEIGYISSRRLGLSEIGKKYVEKLKTVIS